MNPKIDLHKSFKENDKKHKGVIPIEIFYKELKTNGIRIH